MTDHTTFDPVVSRVLQGIGPERAPSHLLERSLDAARLVPQRRPRIALLDPAGWPTTPGWLAYRRTARLATGLVIVLLVLSMFAASLLVGGWLERRMQPNLVFGSAAGGLWIAQSDGSGARQIAGDGLYIEPRFSSDRRWIAVRTVISSPPSLPSQNGPRGEHLQILRADGTVVMDLPSANPATYEWGSVGPSAGLLAAMLDEDLIVIDPRTASFEPIARGEDAGGAFAWSPVGPTLYRAVGRSTNFQPVTRVDIRETEVLRTDAGLRMAGTGSFRILFGRSRSIRGIEAMAVSPDGGTLAFRARTEGWLRSDLAVVAVGQSIPTFLNPAPPDSPWSSATSGVRWTADGTAVVAEFGESIGDAEPTLEAALIPVDGSEMQPFQLGASDGVVSRDSRVLPWNGPMLLGSAVGPERFPSLSNSNLTVVDLWIVDPDGGPPRLVRRDTLGGDLR